MLKRSLDAGPPARRLPHVSPAARWPRTSRTRERLCEAAAEDVYRPLDKPKHHKGHIVILRGNLAPEGASPELSGLMVRKITGPATETQKHCRYFSRFFHLMIISFHIPSVIGPAITV